MGRALLDEALEIASDALRQCYGQRGIVTGPLRRVHWSWDSFFASLGACALGDADVVKANLELYRTSMRQDGLVPRYVSPPLYGLRILGIRLSDRLARPYYGSSFTGAPSKIQNALFVATCLEYALASGDKDYLKENYADIMRAAKWTLSMDRDSDGLIEEGIGENWSETVLKHGNVLFTNVCHYHGLESMARIAGLTGDDVGAAMFRDEAGRTKDALKDRFWTGAYFADWHDGKELHDYLSCDGNVLASLWGAATEEQALSIHREITARGLDSVPLRTNDPVYPGKHIHILTKLIAIPHYHNGLSWLWMGCADAVARERLGLREEARAELERIASLVVRDRTVHEIYTPGGKPYSQPLYTSEHPFAWSAGMLVWALKQFGHQE